MLCGEDSCEEALRRFQDRRTGRLSSQQIFGSLLERLGDERRRPAEVQENQAAFHNIWPRIQLRWGKTDGNQSTKLELMHQNLNCHTFKNGFSSVPKTGHSALCCSDSGFRGQVLLIISRCVNRVKIKTKPAVGPGGHQH